MSLDHAVIWIDHREAHVIQFNESANENEIIHTHIQTLPTCITKQALLVQDMPHLINPICMQ
jgi:hypothetical protein